MFKVILEENFEKRFKVLDKITDNKVKHFR